MKIGEKIKIRRNELGWSLQELADRMGYANKSTIARIESNVIDLPQSKVVKFAEVMGTSVRFLMDWEEVQKNNDAIADIIIRLRSDEVFFDAVKRLNSLDSDKLSGLLALLK
jgi:transcriptional regulator with XRE-family HTH domain